MGDGTHVWGLKGYQVNGTSSVIEQLPHLCEAADCLSNSFMQDAEEQCSILRQQHSVALAEQTASATALQKRVEVLERVCIPPLTYLVVTSIYEAGICSMRIGPSQATDPSNSRAWHMTLCIFGCLEQPGMSWRTLTYCEEDLRS